MTELDKVELGLVNLGENKCYRINPISECGNIVISGDNDFRELCLKHLVEVHNILFPNLRCTLDDVATVWQVKVLQNYKCLCTSLLKGDHIYVEYTYDGDRKRIYSDIYFKKINMCILHR